MKMLTLAGLVLGLVQGKNPEGTEDPGKPTLYFFFSENTPGAPEAARAVANFVKAHSGPLDLRPALLVQDWTALGKITEESPLFRTLRELQVPLQVYDQDALRLAARWKVTHLPAAVLVRDGRAHLIEGADLDPASLFRCSR